MIGGVDDEVYRALSISTWMVWLLSEWIYPEEIPGNLSAPLQGFTWFIWSLSKQIIPTESSLNIALDSIRLRVNGIYTDPEPNWIDRGLKSVETSIRGNLAEIAGSRSFGD